MYFRCVLFIDILVKMRYSYTKKKEWRSPMNTAELSRVCRQVRRDIINMTANAGSGHPGGSLSAVELMVSVFYNHMHVDPENPKAEDRDRFVLTVGGIMVGVACLSMACGLLSARCSAICSQGFAKNLRSLLLGKIQDFSFANTDHFSTSSLITRATTDVTAVRTTMYQLLRTMTRAPIMLLMATVMAFLVHARLAFLFLISIPLLGGVLVLLMKIGQPRFRRMLVKTDAMNRAVQENLVSSRVVKAYVRGGYETDRSMSGINGGHILTTGFGHRALGDSAPAVIDAIKGGAVKHIFLVGGCDGAHPGRNYYTEFVKRTPMDSLILTLACGKFRFNDLDLGDINGIPRILDVGQCNDAYSAVQIALALADAFDCSVNELPLTLVLSWYEQKAVCILLTLLALGIKDIYLGPTLPAFLSETVVKTLVDAYHLQPITHPQQDLDAILHRG